MAFAFTLGLTGFTAKDWAQGACFDLLPPSLTESVNPEHLSSVITTANPLGDEL